MLLASLRPESAPPSPLSHYERPAEHESAVAPTQGGPETTPTGCSLQRRGYELCRARNGTQTNGSRASRLLAAALVGRGAFTRLGWEDSGILPICWPHCRQSAVEVEVVCGTGAARAGRVLGEGSTSGRELTWSACGERRGHTMRPRSMGRAVSRAGRRRGRLSSAAGDGGNCISRANWQPARSGPPALSVAARWSTISSARRGRIWGGSTAAGSIQVAISRRRHLLSASCATKLVSDKTFWGPMRTRTESPTIIPSLRCHSTAAGTASSRLCLARRAARVAGRINCTRGRPPRPPALRAAAERAGHSLAPRASGRRVAFRRPQRGAFEVRAG